MADKPLSAEIKVADLRGEAIRIGEHWITQGNWMVRIDGDKRFSAGVDSKILEKLEDAVAMEDEKFEKIFPGKTAKLIDVKRTEFLIESSIDGKKDLLIRVMCLDPDLEGHERLVFVNERYYQLVGAPGVLKSKDGWMLFRDDMQGAVMAIQMPDGSGTPWWAELCHEETNGNHFYRKKL